MAKMIHRFPAYTPSPAPPLATVNDAAGNMGVQVSLQSTNPVASGYTPRSGIPASHGGSGF